MAGKQRRKPILKPGDVGRIKKEFTDEEIVKALKTKGGRIYQAAKLVGCSATTIYDRAKLDPKIREVIRECRGELVDLAEDNMGKLIRKGSFHASAFVLKTLGKKRGYVERTEMRHGGDRNAPPIQTKSGISYEDLPVELQIQILDALRAKESKEALLPESPPEEPQEESDDESIS